MSPLGFELSGESSGSPEGTHDQSVQGGVAEADTELDPSDEGLETREATAASDPQGLVTELERLRHEVVESDRRVGHAEGRVAAADRRAGEVERRFEDALAGERQTVERRFQEELAREHGKLEQAAAVAARAQETERTLEAELATMRRRLEEAEERTGRSEERAATLERRAREFERRFEDALARERETVEERFQGELAGAHRKLEQAAAVAARAQETERTLEAELEQTRRRLEEVEEHARRSEERAATAERRASELEQVSQILDRKPRSESRMRDTATGGAERQAMAADVPAERKEPSNRATRKVSLGSATFEELRGLGMSVTQAVRVLQYREQGELGSPADLDSVPGLPRAFCENLKKNLTD